MNPAVIAGMMERISKGWCQGSSAEDADGRGVGASEDEAVAWCLWGALLAVGATDEDEVKVSGAIHRQVHRDMLDWNDEPGRTQEDVLDMLAKVKAGLA